MANQSGKDNRSSTRQRIKAGCLSAALAGVWGWMLVQNAGASAEAPDAVPANCASSATSLTAIPPNTEFNGVIDLDRRVLTVTYWNSITRSEQSFDVALADHSCDSIPGLGKFIRSAEQDADTGHAQVCESLAKALRDNVTHIRGLRIDQEALAVHLARSCQ